MSADENKPVEFELNAEQWKAMTPQERLQHANQLHKQLLAEMNEDSDSSEQSDS
jgi:hypothetical protein